MNISNKKIILAFLTVACMLLTIFVHIFQGVNIVYTHLYYLPIILTGIWFYKSAVLLAALLGFFHIGVDIYAGHFFTASPILRTCSFIVTALLVGTISHKRDILSTQLEKVNSAMLDFICEIDKNGNINYVSTSIKHTLGYRPEDLQEKSIFDFIYEDDKEKVREVFTEAIKDQRTFRIDYRFMDSKNSFVWVESMGNPANIENAVTVYIWGSRDISYRKEFEKKLEHLSYHDYLTGLYNRRYFEEKLMLYNKDNYFPLSLLLCDIDGLKIINDNLGHQYGDEFIVQSADVLKRFVNTDIIIARTGGDEFVVLIPRCHLPEVEKIRNSILKEIRKRQIKYNCTEIPLIISVGYAIKYDNSITVNELYSEAEDNMYRHKLENRKIVRDIFKKYNFVCNLRSNTK